MADPHSYDLKPHKEYSPISISYTDMPGKNFHLVSSKSARDTAMKYRHGKEQYGNENSPWQKQKFFSIRTTVFHSLMQNKNKSRETFWVHFQLYAHNYLIFKNIN